MEGILGDTQVVLHRRPGPPQFLKFRVIPVSLDVREGLQNCGVSVHTPLLHAAGTPVNSPVYACCPVRSQQCFLVHGCKATAAKPFLELDCVSAPEH